MEQRSVGELLLGSLTVVLITSFFDKAGLVVSSGFCFIRSRNERVYSYCGFFSAEESNSVDLP